jgi:hypothetical protein
MKYEPDNPQHRITLAQSIIELMIYAEFKEEPNSGEKVFSRQVQDGLRVVVYTSIVGKEVREKDDDAIRVCGVYTTKDKEERGIVKSSRVYRTGEVEEISNRLLQRMREVWKKTQTVERCNQCSAPKFMSKKGHLVCCEICWEQKEN